MSQPKVADRDTVVRSTQVRTKLKGDNSWCKTPRDTEDGPQEEKPWLAEVRARRLNGAPIDTSPVTSPVKSTPPSIPAKPETARAPTTGYRTRGGFTQPDKSVTPTGNGFSQATQFTKRTSDTYKRIAPHTVRPTSESQGGPLSSEEQEKRTEAASSVLKRSSAKQRSYVLSAAKKFESQPPDTTVVNNTVSFVARRVEITDEDEKPVAVQPSPVVPVTSVAPEPGPRKTVNTSLETSADVTVNEPVTPKLSVVTPVLVKDEPLPAAVSSKDLFEDMEPGGAKVATPLPELIAECIQAASSKPESEVSDISQQDDKVLVDRNIVPSKLTKWPPPKPTPNDSDHSEPPAPVVLPTLSPTAASKAPVAPVRVDPNRVAPTPVAPVRVDPNRVAPTPVAPARVDANRVAPTPVAPFRVEPNPVTPVQLSPTPVEPNRVAPTPVAPVRVDPNRVVPAPVTPVQLSPTPVDPTPVAPTPVAPVRVTPTPVARTPLSTSSLITVNTESESEPVVVPEWKPSRKSSSSGDTLASLSDTLISFDTIPSSITKDESALPEEEESSKDATENRAEQDDDEQSDDAQEHYKYDDNDTDEDADADAGSDKTNEGDGKCDGVSDEHDSDPSGPEDEPGDPRAPAPAGPARWSQELLSELRSESTPQSNGDPLDLLADKVTLIDSEARRGDDAEPWRSSARTTVTEWSSADPFDPYPIGTTSPNSSSDLLQPLSSISINSESSSEYQRPSGFDGIGRNALGSFADDVVSNETSTTSISARRSWTRTLEADAPPRTLAGESQEEEGQVEDSQTVIKFERKSSENDSPWDRWTSPTIYHVTSDAGEDGQEDSGSLRESHTVTTVTTIREMRSEPEPAMDRYHSYSGTATREEPRAPTPEPEAKKGFVYVKEYVNATEMSSLNSRGELDGESDYLTSSSLNYGYSPSFSRAPLSSTCTYCGQQVGEDSKITIEHLGINCHPTCFKCGVCHDHMGDLLHSMFVHGGIVHCEKCYSKV